MKAKVGFIPKFWNKIVFFIHMFKCILNCVIVAFFLNFSGLAAIGMDALFIGGFLRNLLVWTFGTRLFFGVGSYSMRYQRFSSVPELCPVGANVSAPLPTTTPSEL